MGEKKGNIWLYLFIIGYPLFVYYNTINLLALSSEVLLDLLEIPYEKYYIVYIFFILLYSAVYPFNMIYVIRRTFKHENLEFLKDFRFVWIIPCFILAMLFFGEWAWLGGAILMYPLFMLAVNRFGILGIGLVSVIVLFVPQVINAVITVKKYRKEIKKMFIFLYILTVITILIGYYRLERVMSG